MDRPRQVLWCAVATVVWTLASPALAQANDPPRAVASAGLNIDTGEVLNLVTVFMGPTDTGVPVTVSGAGSSDPDNDPLSYSWECRGANNEKCIFVVGTQNQVTFRPEFPEGTWDITLTVNDGNNHTATDSVRVKVLVDRTPPTVTPPDNMTVSVTATDGARGADSDKLHDFLFNSATATDNSTTIFSSLPPQVNGVDVDDTTVFPLGTTTVTFRIPDRFGNVGAATATLSVIDLQPGDLFVGNGIDTGFGGMAGVIYRIRDGQVSIFCESPRDGADPNHWAAPEYITVDSKGRVAAMAHLLFPNSYKFLRCSRAGAQPEKLGTFFGGFADPAWPQPFPNRNLDRIKGLHLQRSKRLVFEDGIEPKTVTEEKYVFAGGVESSPNINDRHIYSLGTDSLVWKEHELEPVGIGTVGQLLPEMYFHSKNESVTLPLLGGFNVPAPVASTYMVGGATVRRDFRPLELQFSGTTPAGEFVAGLQLFGGMKQLSDADLANDIHSPMESSGCTQVGQFRTSWNSPSRARLGAFSSVTFDKDLGLVLKADQGGLPAWMGQVSEALINHDGLDDQANMVLNGFNGCAAQPIVDFESLTPGYHSDPTTGEGMDPRRVAVGVDGLYGTQPETGRVIKLQPGTGISTVANVPFIAGAGIGAYPPQLGNVHATTVIVRIDSPVEVVVSDVHGRRLGAIAGQPINEFGQWGHDTGPESHPRFYVINHPQPGPYAVRSVGTGAGPFTVHAYSVNTTTGVSRHLSSSGVASPGAPGKHDFTLDASGAIALVNGAPNANAGADQTLEAAANGSAVVTLDGSASADPDGDELSFTWAGPNAFARGATAQLTLPVGVHLVALTVDDGKGGSAEDTVRITVLPNPDTPVDMTPPIVTALVTPAPNAAGWNKSRPTVTWSVEDPESGLTSSSGCAATSVDQDTSSVTFTCVATNGADLTSSASVTVKLDTQAPKVALLQPADGRMLLLNAVAATNYTCTDTGSGVAGCEAAVLSGGRLNTAAPGEHAFTVVATDEAGNRTTRTHHYRIRYNFQGFFPLLLNPPLVNLGPAGHTFAVKFRLLDANGAFVADPAAIAATTLHRVCGSGTGAEISVGPDQWSYAVSTGLRTFNWKTVKPQAGCWILKVRLADESTQSLWFVLW